MIWHIRPSKWQWCWNIFERKDHFLNWHSQRTTLDCHTTKRHASIIGPHWWSRLQWRLRSIWMCAVFIYAWFLCHVIKLCCIRLLCWGKWNHVEAHGLCSHRGPWVGQRLYYSQGPCCCLWCCGVTTKPHEDSMVRDDDWSHVKFCGHRKAGLALLSPQYCGVLGVGELVQC